MDFFVEIAAEVLELFCEGAAEYADSPKRSRLVRGLIYAVLLGIPCAGFGYGGFCLYDNRNTIGAVLCWVAAALFALGWGYLTFRKKRRFK